MVLDFGVDIIDGKQRIAIRLSVFMLSAALFISPLYICFALILRSASFSLVVSVYASSSQV